MLEARHFLAPVETALNGLGVDSTTNIDVDTAQSVMPHHRLAHDRGLSAVGALRGGGAGGATPSSIQSIQSSLHDESVGSSSSHMHTAHEERPVAGPVAGPGPVDVSHPRTLASKGSFASMSGGMAGAQDRLKRKDEVRTRIRATLRKVVAGLVVFSKKRSIPTNGATLS